MSIQPRVRLVPATAALLNALVSDPTQFSEMLGSPIPQGWPEFPEAISSTLEHLQDAGDIESAWSMQLFVDDATGELIGSGGFHSPPSDRAVEIGYEVAPTFRGRGFGSASARALVERAFGSRDVDTVIAHTLPGPNPSTWVLESLGFTLAGTQDDPDEGVVCEWRLPRP